ncbi:MAG: hypothetical protein ABI760_01640 [Ferruginibacter sp.]
MKISIRHFSNKLGIDGAIAYAVLARLIQAVGGIISIVFIANYLNKVEQGYYFTFGSILAIQIFFELGLSTIITQFVAHEMANLVWISSTELGGSAIAISRLSSLLHFCFKWFAVVAFILLFILILAGYLFFTRYGGKSEPVNWELPWVIISISTACSLMVSPILAFFEGLGKVKDVSIIRVIQQCCQILVLFICFIAGFKLYSSPIAYIVTLLATSACIIFSNKILLLQYIWKQLKTWKVNYKMEIFPYQWRIALSWISGYFVFQLFNPVIFATDGPMAAGQMGLTLAVLGGILSVSLSWVNTRVPLFSRLIARREYAALDIAFNRTVKQASLICIICLSILIAGVLAMQNLEITMSNRFLPLFPLILLCITTFINQFVSALATYLRCHKQEPFLVLSIVSGILTAMSTFIFGKLYGVIGITVGYSALTIFVSLIWGVLIYQKKKKLWHQ